MSPADMVLLAVHRFARDFQAHWPLELPPIRLVAAVDCMAVAVTIAGFVGAADMRLVMHRCNFVPVVGHFCA